MANVLVVGGAGYVGSATCAWLLDQGHAVHVLDDLSTGRRGLVLGHGFTQARAGDRARVLPLLKQGRFDCVMHFAARSLVSESVRKPQEYFENNVEQTRQLLEMMIEVGCLRFIFSSTAAIFGDPGTELIDEDTPRAPINPYGQTKLEVEQLLQRFARDRALRSVSLRYFNAAGAEPGLRVGEMHEPETHLIPRIVKAAMAGLPVQLFGTDYPTPDGTCVRDYIHVTDLAAAHAAAMRRLMAPSLVAGSFEGFNLGSQVGFSVRQVIEATEQVTGFKIDIEERPRRAGDPPRLVARNDRARAELGFDPSRNSGLHSMIRSAWNWERKRLGKLGRAVFLDRDGTLNEDPGYLNDPAQLKLLPGVPEALASLQKAGFRLVIVSNQSGVGRGWIRRESLDEIHWRLDDLLAPAAAKIDRYELCLHRPEEDCECRKPKPRLLLRAAHELGLDPARSYMVGDKASDIEAGRRANCRGSVLVRTGAGRESEAALPAGRAHFIADALPEAVQWILSQETAGS